MKHQTLITKVEFQIASDVSGDEKDDAVFVEVSSPDLVAPGDRIIDNQFMVGEWRQGKAHILLAPRALGVWISLDLLEDTLRKLKDRLETIKDL